MGGASIGFTGERGWEGLAYIHAASYGLCSKFSVAFLNESTKVHNPRRDCAILTLAHETH